MSHKLIEHDDPRVFHDAVIGHLLQSEVECCVQIGLIRRMAREGYSPISPDELARPLLWTIQDGPQVELVAIQTLKESMLVSSASQAAMTCLADGLAARRWSGTSLIGVSPSIGELTERYAEVSLRRRRLVLRLRVFQLDSVVWPNAVSGAMRVCHSEYREILARFVAGFEADTGQTSLEDAQSRADRLIADRRVFIWVDAEPVAMAAYSGETPNGIRVSWVYTPPQFRGKGYASNLVAFLSQHLLDEGRRYCFLFTDQANPTSNFIYQKLGYRPVSDSERWEFSG
jgi:GNAT superfamily N-acetyltransferase